MALVKMGDQLSVSAVQQSTTESKGKGHVKVLDEETYIQVSVFRKVYTVMSFVWIIGKKLREVSTTWFDILLNRFICWVSVLTISYYITVSQAYF